MRGELDRGGAEEKEKNDYKELEWRIRTVEENGRGANGKEETGVDIWRRNYRRN